MKNLAFQLVQYVLFASVSILHGAQYNTLISFHHIWVPIWLQSWSWSSALVGRLGLHNFPSFLKSRKPYKSITPLWVYDLPFIANFSTIVHVIVKLEQVPMAPYFRCTRNRSPVSVYCRVLNLLNLDWWLTASAAPRFNNKNPKQ